MRYFLLLLIALCGTASAESSIAVDNTPKLTATAALNFRVIIPPTIKINIPTDGAKVIASTNIPKQQVARTIIEEPAMYASIADPRGLDYVPPVITYTVALP